MPAELDVNASAGRADTTAVPWLLDVRAVFYRTDVLRRAGTGPGQGLRGLESFESTLAAIKGPVGGVTPLPSAATTTSG